jgi:two-component system KDP operon response regulator KdpE
MLMTKILLIDDDPMMLQLLKLYLEGEGFQLATAEGGQQGLAIAQKELPDLVILDLMMPVMDGFETCRRLREMGVQTILVISNRRDERSMIRVLELGADAYLHKPFELPVLQAKIRTLLRRSGQRTPSECTVYDDGNLMVDLNKRRVEVDGQMVQLTATEFRLLSILLRNVGRVVTHEALIREVWGTDKDAGLTSLKLYIYYLRRKIERQPKKPHYLLAEWGVGYRFREPKSVTQLAT